MYIIIVNTDAKIAFSFLFNMFAHLGIFFFLLPGVLAGNFFSILLENS